MERPIKGGYILISLGLVALSAGASLTVDYERITKTKKHIVLTGIKVAGTIMPDVTVKPIFGNGTITFSDVYGYDIVVSSNGSASVSEHVAPSGGTKLYNHEINFRGTSSGNGKCATMPFHVISTRETPYNLTNDMSLLVGSNLISLTDDNPVLGCAFDIDSTQQKVIITDAVNETVEYSNISDFTDTVTEL